jgi:hypothetical protein
MNKINFCTFWDSVKLGFAISSSSHIYELVRKHLSCHVCVYQLRKLGLKGGFQIEKGVKGEETTGKREEQKMCGDGAKGRETRHKSTVTRREIIF